MKLVQVLDSGEEDHSHVEKLCFDFSDFKRLESYTKCFLNAKLEPEKLYKLKPNFNLDHSLKTYRASDISKCSEQEVGIQESKWCYF
jgi:hypothetical protein